MTLQQLHYLDTWNIGRSGDLGGGWSVRTTWMPTYEYFETEIVSPHAILGDTFHTYEMEEARLMHAETVKQVQRMLEERGVVA